MQIWWLMKIFVKKLKFQFFFFNFIYFSSKGPFLPEFVPQSWKNLINELWHKDPKSRPSAFSEILSRSIIAATRK